MRYRLSTLVILTAIGPPLIAGAYWAATWVGANPVAFVIFAMAMWVVAPVAWYYELMSMVCGPDPFQPSRRKKRRRIRVRIERYAYGST